MIKTVNRSKIKSEKDLNDRLHTIFRVPLQVTSQSLGDHKSFLMCHSYLSAKCSKGDQVEIWLSRHFHYHPGSSFLPKLSRNDENSTRRELND